MFVSANRPGLLPKEWQIQNKKIASEWYTLDGDIVFEDEKDQEENKENSESWDLEKEIEKAKS